MKTLTKLLTNFWKAFRNFLRTFNDRNGSSICSLGTWSHGFSGCVGVQRVEILLYSLSNLFLHSVAGPQTNGHDEAKEFYFLSNVNNFCQNLFTFDKKSSHATSRPFKNRINKPKKWSWKFTEELLSLKLLLLLPDCWCFFFEGYFVVPVPSLFFGVRGCSRACRHRCGRRGGYGRFCAAWRLRENCLSVLDVLDTFERIWHFWRFLLDLFGCVGAFLRLHLALDSTRRYRYFRVQVACSAITANFTVVSAEERAEGAAYVQAQYFPTLWCLGC